jgi:hypothetical protein
MLFTWLLKKLTEKPGRDYREVTSRAKDAYGTLSLKFCRPGHRHQGLAYGNHPKHDPARERIVERQCADDACVFSTRREKDLAGIAMVDDYEYHLRKDGGRWFVTSVLYVCDDGKYEDL